LDRRGGLTGGAAATVTGVATVGATTGGASRTAPRDFEAPALRTARGTDVLALLRTRETELGGFFFRAVLVLMASPTVATL
jgi:hypothetical protein